MRGSGEAFVRIVVAVGVLTTLSVIVADVGAPEESTAVSSASVAQASDDWLPDVPANETAQGAGSTRTPSPEFSTMTSGVHSPATNAPT